MTYHNLIACQGFSVFVHLGTFLWLSELLFPGSMAGIPQKFPIARGAEEKLT
jgi:hypothetical protein